MATRRSPERQHDTWGTPTSVRQSLILLIFRDRPWSRSANRSAPSHLRAYSSGGRPGTTDNRPQIAVLRMRAFLTFVAWSIVVPRGGDSLYRRRNTRRRCARGHCFISMLVVWCVGNLTPAQAQAEDLLIADNGRISRVVSTEVFTEHWSPNGQFYSTENSQPPYNGSVRRASDGSVVTQLPQGGVDAFIADNGTAKFSIAVNGLIAKYAGIQPLGSDHWSSVKHGVLSGDGTKIISLIERQEPDPAAPSWFRHRSTTIYQYDVATGVTRSLGTTSYYLNAPAGSTFWNAFWGINYDGSQIVLSYCLSTDFGLDTGRWGSCDEGSHDDPLHWVWQGYGRVPLSDPYATPNWLLFPGDALGELNYLGHFPHGLRYLSSDANAALMTRSDGIVGPLWVYNVDTGVAREAPTMNGHPCTERLASAILSSRGHFLLCAMGESSPDVYVVNTVTNAITKIAHGTGQVSNLDSQWVADDGSAAAIRIVTDRGYGTYRWTADSSGGNNGGGGDGGSHNEGPKPPSPERCDVPSGSGSRLTLTPTRQTLSIGASATLTGSVGTVGPVIGQPGRQVRFEVVCGPNRGRAASPITNGQGEASFSYPDTGGAGTDRIVATWQIRSQTFRALAAVVWTKLPVGTCDPGSNTSWLQIAGITFACVLSGQVWDDPTLVSAKKRCVIKIGLSPFVPFSRALQLPRFAKQASKIELSLRDLRTAVKAASYPRKATGDAEAVDNILNALERSRTPEQALVTAVSSRRILDGLILKLGEGGRDARVSAQRIAVFKAALGELLEALSGVQDVKDCKAAFLGP